MRIPGGSHPIFLITSKRTKESKRLKLPRRRNCLLSSPFPQRSPFSRHPIPPFPPFLHPPSVFTAKPASKFSFPHRKWPFPPPTGDDTTISRPFQRFPAAVFSSIKCVFHSLIPITEAWLPIIPKTRVAEIPSPTPLSSSPEF
ncbi:unnamed protein product [Cuscuta epithymum]|uniref:Uncharacterized protein n=1 Tax=Cuscuta epithymum TaxID=186058 RepID=A0AAV0D5B2_9ASTE|nr:unnamed protein product [Cuscuta epithymum]